MRYTTALKFSVFRCVLPCWKSTRFCSVSKTCPPVPPRFGGIFDFDSKKERLEEVDRELEVPDVWNDPAREQELGKERDALARVVDTLVNMAQGLDDNADLLAMAAEEDDEDSVAAIDRDVAEFEKQIGDLEFRRMFSGEMDESNAYLDIQSGAGGTESQDWASILLRMYLRWGDRRGFKTEVMELSDGEVAGIKSATVRFEGEYAFGWLRTEIGVHRLVRKSPFDSDNRRHTSFASVFVSPEVDDNIEIEVNPADLRVDVFRASGAGGQHVNRTESAVRFTHLPTGVVVACQAERSQIQNRERAMKMLKAKLYELEIQKRNAVSQALEETKSDVSWGNQIRSYVLDQSRIKDLRTGHETGNTQAVLDGDLDPFIEASLKSGL